jgi:hypothetical protein
LKPKQRRFVSRLEGFLMFLMSRRQTTDFDLFKELSGKSVQSGAVNCRGTGWGGAFLETWPPKEDYELTVRAGEGIFENCSENEILPTRKVQGIFVKATNFREIIASNPIRSG